LVEVLDMLQIQVSLPTILLMLVQELALIKDVFLFHQED
jgi:hypothetical protein